MVERNGESTPSAISFINGRDLECRNEFGGIPGYLSEGGPNIYWVLKLHDKRMG